jgi:uncharacterized protein
MKLTADSLRLSPTDLSNHLTCRRRTGLDLAVALGSLEPPQPRDSSVDALRARGDAHERAYVESLRVARLHVVEIESSAAPGVRAARTIDAMRAGADVVVQAALMDDRWLGYADILRRVPGRSALGDWFYEPYDTKLARKTRGGTILQLSIYVDLLERVQDRRPDRFWVVAPGRDGVPFLVTPYRYGDYAAYVRLVSRQLSATLALGPEAIGAAYYPEPVEACDVCRWSEGCHRRRRKDDHLSFVAGIGRVHREELSARGFPRLSDVAAMPLPVPFTPARGSRETYARLREQARVQHAQRTTGRPVYELLPAEEGHGLARLPEPSPGDLFLDLEAARFAREGGREYLFGVWTRENGYTALWAFSDADERAAFEATIDRMVCALAEHSGAHIYHFGQYEPSAIKRLMGRYASRGDAVDELLRAERFVDLHAIVRRALRAGVESYSLKQLEQFYGFTRAQRLGDVAAHRVAIELALEAGAAAAIAGATRAAVQTYNEDDCRSTAALREWLERLRAELIEQGTAVSRPVPKDGEASDRVGDLEARQEAARMRLLEGLSPEAAGAAHDQHPRWLLAYLIDWHRREDKSAWWEYYRVRDLPEAELFEEPLAIAGLEFLERVRVVLHAKTGRPTGSVVDRYRYPPQEVELGRKGKLSMPGGDRIGTLARHDRQARTLDIEKGPGRADVHPSAVFEGDVIPTAVQQQALLRVAADPDAVNCGTDLLFRRVPRLRSGAFERQPGESVQDFAVRIAADLDGTTLAIQGPPGAGKTYVGARMIRALVRAGKKVGVTAASHKVIRNLLDEVLKQETAAVTTVDVQLEGPGFSPARMREQEGTDVGPGLQPRPTGERGGPLSQRSAPRSGSVGDHCHSRPIVRLGHKCDPNEEDGEGDSAIAAFGKNETALAALASDEINVLGATSWLWSREDATASVDVLFVDEAGQLSLANALAVSGAANSLVLLGDPQQLEQPQKGTHPDGVGVSALDHVLAGAATMPEARGLFLPTTWRLHPSICAFTSEVFYDGKLQPKPGLDRQSLFGTTPFDGAGLWFVPVEHDGNQNSSGEEVDAVEHIVAKLLVPGAQWQDEHGVRHPIAPGDLRIVAPYNAQVNRLTDRFAGRGVPVGTVDKFQGQEAPVVIYSMTTSSPEDAPRGMEFLYSLNRLNVATSRARCAAILVASPRLLEPQCRTPRQMRLANALCRYAEMARTVKIGEAGTSVRPGTSLIS